MEVQGLIHTSRNGTKFTGSGHYFTDTPSQRVDMVEVVVPSGLQGTQLLQDVTELGKDMSHLFFSQLFGWKGLPVEYFFTSA